MFQVKGMAGHKWFGGIPSGTSAKPPGVEILNFSPTLVTLVPQLEFYWNLPEKDCRSKLLEMAGFRMGSGNVETDDERIKEKTSLLKLRI